MCYQFQTTKMLDGSSFTAVALRAPTGCPFVVVLRSSVSAIERQLWRKPTLTHFYSAAIYDPERTLDEEFSTAANGTLESFK
jgi:hypothetical protein